MAHVEGGREKLADVSAQEARQRALGKASEAQLRELILKLEAGLREQCVIAEVEEELIRRGVKP